MQIFQFIRYQWIWFTVLDGEHCVYVIIYSSEWLIYSFIKPSCRFQQIVPTARQRRIDWIDLSPSLAAGSSSGLPWHCWLRDHAHQRPRTLFPPTVQRARTVHALSARLLAGALHTLDCDWSSVATAGACCEFCFSFFFFSPPCVLHIQLREKAASQRQKPPQPYPSPGRSTGNRRLFVLYWLWQQKSDI